MCIRDRYVLESNVEDYKSVRANDRLIEIDPQEYQMAVAQADADLQQAVADIETAKATLRNAQEASKVAKANADVQASRKTKVTADLTRDKNLYEGGSTTKKVLDDSQANLEVQARQYDACLLYTSRCV